MADKSVQCAHILFFEKLGQKDRQTNYRGQNGGQKCAHILFSEKLGQKDGH